MAWNFRDWGDKFCRVISIFKSPKTLSDRTQTSTRRLRFWILSIKLPRKLVIRGSEKHMVSKFTNLTSNHKEKKGLFHVFSCTTNPFMEVGLASALSTSPRTKQHLWHRRDWSASLKLKIWNKRCFQWIRWSWFTWKHQRKMGECWLRVFSAFPQLSIDLSSSLSPSSSQPSGTTTKPKKSTT